MIAKLSKESSLPSVANAGWSAQIEQRYRCQLSPELADWFDAEIWKRTGHCEYHLPVDPKSLLEEAPEVIWPALMPCDFLPLLSNDAGDWLCVRFNDDSTASQIVHWYHGGGDWIPWGESIAEAIMFDALRQQLPGPKRAHATPAESLLPGGKKSKRAADPIVAWACRFMPPDVVSLINNKKSESDTAAILLETGVCEIAVRCTLVEDALHEPLSDVLSRELAEQLQIDWNTAIEWMFDIDRVPTDIRRHFQRDFKLPSDAAQDWETAAQHCRRVTELAPSLAWAWDILGYCQERSGAMEDALIAYIRGAQSSIFTDQSVRLRTHWTASQSSKFSAARLLNVAPSLVQNSTYLRMLCEGTPEQRRIQVALHWLAESDQATAIGDVGVAHQNLFRAGWDLGAEPIAVYGDILQRIAETAVQADRAAQAELAETHRACLTARFGV